MRLDLTHLDKWLVKRGEDGAAYLVHHNGVRFGVIASWGKGWDHVSVSTTRRCPSWDEMHWFREQFFALEEPVMQLHPPQSTYVNNHPFCLHLWRPQTVAIPLPPPEFVGF